MTSFVTSRDGTRIAHDVLGDGPPVVVVSGLFCTRQTTQDLAEHLAARCTVVNYDRRGRGESADTPPYAVEREVEDLAAVIDAVGGSAAVYGHSSGAGLALRAAAAGLPITRLVAHEPPYGGDDDESQASARGLAGIVRTALAEDRRADAIAAFFEPMGMPPEIVEAMTADPAMLAVAPTMNYDFAVMGDADGGTIPEAMVRSIDVPTLVVAGSESPEFFRDTAARLADLLPDATSVLLTGHDHGAPADVVAPVVADFVTAAPLRAL
jgi:pimeloyl-ACP methyl ester carboxylesterase